MIKVDPVAGYIFYSDPIAGYNVPDYTLVRSDMSGSNTIALLKSNKKSHIGDKISTITLDYQNRKIYFIDLDTNVIFEIGYDHQFNQKPKAVVCAGTNSGTQCPTTPSLSAIAFYDQQLYWVEEEDGKITKTPFF